MQRFSHIVLGRLPLYLYTKLFMTQGRDQTPFGPENTFSVFHSPVSSSPRPVCTKTPNFGFVLKNQKKRPGRTRASETRSATVFQKLPCFSFFLFYKESRMRSNPQVSLNFHSLCFFLSFLFSIVIKCWRNSFISDSCTCSREMLDVGVSFIFQTKLIIAGVEMVSIPLPFFFCSVVFHANVTWRLKNFCVHSALSDFWFSHPQPRWLMGKEIQTTGVLPHPPHSGISRLGEQAVFSRTVPVLSSSPAGQSCLTRESSLPEMTRCREGVSSRDDDKP